MSLHVLKPGLHSAIVDLGRPASRSLGVPVSGAADRSALVLGNALVGNPPDLAALECTLHGPTLQTTEPAGCVVVGAPCHLHTDRKPLSFGHTFNLEAGETLYLGGITSGMRSYLCVRGGFQSRTVLASRSALAPISKGDDLPVIAGHVPLRFIQREWIAAREPLELRITPGPQADWFALDALVHRMFVVRPESNRMGLRLQGEPLDYPAGREMVSEPVCPGAVQITRDGQSIILGMDGQTIGGYPKIAQVIQADVDRLGQLRPGQSLKFLLVNLEEAEAAYHERAAELKQWLTRLRLEGSVTRTLL